MKVDFIIVVVLYKTSLGDSLTIRSLLGITGVPFDLVIWDNSPSPVPEYDLRLLQSKVETTQYVHTPENVSLARIYNQTAFQNSNSDFLVIFDQDSQFEVTFFEKALKAIMENTSVNLFLPFIKKENKIFSPGDFFLIKGKYWKNLHLGLVNSKNKVAIASGMIIRMDFLIKHNPVFDERLRLYGIDSSFVIEYAKHNKYFFVLDYNLSHSLSVNEEETREKKLFRFRDMRFSILRIAERRTYFHFLLAKGYVLYLSVKFSLKYRNTGFLKG